MRQIVRHRGGPCDEVRSRVESGRDQRSKAGGNRQGRVSKILTRKRRTKKNEFEKGVGVPRRSGNAKGTKKVALIRFGRGANVDKVLAKYTSDRLRNVGVAGYWCQSFVVASHSV